MQILRLTKTHPQMMLGQRAAKPKIRVRQEGDEYPVSAIPEKKAAILSPNPKSAKAKPHIAIVSETLLFTRLLSCGQFFVTQRPMIVVPSQSVLWVLHAPKLRIGVGGNCSAN